MSVFLFITSVTCIVIFLVVIRKITHYNKDVFNGMFYGILGTSFISTIFQIIQGKEAYFESVSKLWNDPIINIIVHSLLLILVIGCAVVDYKNKE